MLAAQDSSHHPVAALIFIVILIVVTVPMLYVMLRALRTSLDIERASLKKLGPQQKRLLLALVASELVFVGIGFAIGYATAQSSNPFIMGALGGFAGGCGWVVLCWVVAGFIRKNKRTAQ